MHATRIPFFRWMLVCLLVAVGVAVRAQTTSQTKPPDAPPPGKGGLSTPNDDPFPSTYHAPAAKPFEFATRAEKVFIRGREVQAPSRQELLTDRYKKPGPPR